IEVAETGKNIEFEFLYTGEIPKWYLISLSKMEDGVTASFQDISEIKKYEDELKENIIELERSNTELEQYAYAASHDLQEPLRKIRAFGSYLQDSQAEKLDEKGRHQLQKIIDAAERMSILIRDILGFSSIRKESHFVLSDLNEVVAGVLQDLDLVITQKQAIIKKGKLPVVEAIPLQMTQLFYNLVNNSLKFVKEGRKPLIEISCRHVNAKEKPVELPDHLSYVEITVKDNGIGFRQDYVEQIFGLFKRLNDKQYYPGSGIGLALCKKVVDNHHGFIRAVGMEDHGANFLIYLPEKQACEIVES
ncbi:MAG: sensor histidine kinase, partial [Flavitalea sp.]